MRPQPADHILIDTRKLVFCLWHAVSKTISHRLRRASASGAKLTLARVWVTATPPEIGGVHPLPLTLVRFLEGPGSFLVTAFYAICRSIELRTALPERVRVARCLWLAATADQTKARGIRIFSNPGVRSRNVEPPIHAPLQRMVYKLNPFRVGGTRVPHHPSSSSPISPVVSHTHAYH